MFVFDGAVSSIRCNEFVYQSACLGHLIDSPMKQLLLMIIINSHTRQVLISICELAGWQEAVAVVPIRYIAADVGKDLKLACAEESDLLHSEEFNVMWIREGREDGQAERLKIEPNGALKLLNVSVDDAGNYSCTLDDIVKAIINVEVKSMS